MHCANSNLMDVDVTSPEGELPGDVVVVGLDGPVVVERDG
jgi:hypothetical protein